MALAMRLPLVSVENLLVAEKTEVCKAVILFWHCLKIVVYVLPFCRVERLFLWALLRSTAVVHLGLVLELAMVFVRFLARTEFYLFSLILIDSLYL